MIEVIIAEFCYLFGVVLGYYLGYKNGLKAQKTRRNTKNTLLK